MFTIGVNSYERRIFMAGIRTVAKRAMVSPATVSRFLNEDSTLKITDETKQRILEAVAFYNYKPKERERKSTLEIGVLTTVSEIQELEDPYFRSIRVGIISECAKSNVVIKKIVYYQTNQSFDFEQLSQCGAILAIGRFQNEVYAELMTMNANIIAIDVPSNELAFPIDSVYTDLTKATMNHLERLYQNGHRHISFIGGKKKLLGKDGHVSIDDQEVRYQAYLDWMNKKGLSEQIDYYLGDWGYEEGYRLTEELLDKHQDNLPTALVVASDPMAVGVYRALQKRGITIPQDISVVSFDDLEVAQYLTPTLSSVAISAEEIGKIAVRLAKQRLTKARKIHVNVEVGYQVKVRESERLLEK